MINPEKITNYKSTDFDLEEIIIFWICVAGKTASTMSKLLDEFFKSLCIEFGYKSPFKLVKSITSIEELANRLKNNGIGCYKNKAKSLHSLVNSDLDLRSCNVEDLLKIYGIGPKTARCFILHSRENAACAGLDVHILTFLKDLGYDVPTSTPTNNKKYKEVEKLFIDITNTTKKTYAELDLLIWRVYSKHKHLKPILLKYFERKVNVENIIFEGANNKRKQKRKTC